MDQESKQEHHQLDRSQNKALKSLKEKLNSMYVNKQVFMWGIPLTMTSNEKSDIILLKFLKAKEFRVQDSYNMLVKCLSWRKDFGVDSIVGQDLGFKELEGVVSYFNGFDKEGHPIWWNNHYGIFRNKKIYKKFLGDDKKLQKFIKWKIQVLERGILKMLDFSPGGVNSFTEVYDATGLPLEEYVFLSKHMLPLFNDYYPGIVDFKVHACIYFLLIILNLKLY